jgi:transposase
MNKKAYKYWWWVYLVYCLKSIQWHHLQVRTQLMVLESILCRYCKSDEVVRYGTQNSLPRLRCKACGRTFKTEYVYRACEPGVKDQIIDMAVNGSGVRDTARVLGIGKGTVLAALKKSPPRSSPSTRSLAPKPSP